MIGWNANTTICVRCCSGGCSRERTPEQGATALRLAGAVAWFWRRRGYLSEGQRWLEALLARYPTAPAAIRAKALQWGGPLGARSGRRCAWDRAV